METCKSGNIRCILISILAIRFNFARADEVVSAINAYAKCPTRLFGECLLEHASITIQSRLILENTADELIALSDSRIDQLLSSLNAAEALGPEVHRVNSAEIRETIISIRTAPTTRFDPFETRVSSSTVHNTPPVGRLRSARLHARGGMGEVFVARDEHLDREVALKELQARYADHPEMQARFVREAKITGSLDHPGIVPVYDLGHYPDGRPYYTMKFIHGESLCKAIEEYHRLLETQADPGEISLTFRRLLKRFVDVCSTLDFAHSRGILHRDIKPDNIMLGRFGETLVVDWGLAKPIGPKQAKPPTPNEVRTEVGAMMGTLAYMSPEQAAGKIEELTLASDIYSLGATFYTLLTGRLPVEKKKQDEMLEDVRNARFPHPRSVNPQVPAALEAICLKAMALKVDRRYSWAREMADDIERWLADEPISVYHELPFKRLWRWGQRHRWVVITVGVMSATIVLVFLLSSIVIALAALSLALIGGTVGALAGLLQGKPRHGAEQGAALGFRIGTFLTITIFVVWLTYKTFAYVSN